MQTRLPLLAALFPICLLAACASTPHSMSMPLKPFDQAGLPEAVKVPAGHRVAIETVGVGEITYECRAKANAGDVHEWVFAGPQADLTNRQGAKMGTYYGPPATWAATDGSTVTGTQLAIAPNGAGNIPLQLVKANPATGNGALTGVTHIQRVATQGGVAPSSPCDKGLAGRKDVVKYQADYIFWKSN